jgi:hypothetical protein
MPGLGLPDDILQLLPQDVGAMPQMQLGRTCKRFQQEKQIGFGWPRSCCVRSACPLLDTLELVHIVMMRTLLAQPRPGTWEAHPHTWHLSAPTLGLWGAGCTALHSSYLQPSST